MDNLFNEELPAGNQTVQTAVETAPVNFKTLQEVEKEHILQALELSGGSKVKAAGLLGVSVKTVYNKLNSYKTPESTTEPESL